MILDLREDAGRIRALIERRVNGQAAAAAKGAPPVGRMDVGYQYDQAGWVSVFLDTRPNATQDGEWTRHIGKNTLALDHWYEAFQLLGEEPFTIVLAEGEQVEAGTSMEEQEFASILGETIRDVLLAMRTAGVFEPLPKRPGCQMGIEEFEGNYSWPPLEEAGKVNLV